MTTTPTIIDWHRDIFDALRQQDVSLVCRIPLLTIVSMRGEWGELIPWQVPMGEGTPGVLEAMGVRVFRADRQDEVGSTVDAAAKLAFNTRQSTAVLLSQRMIGAKQFKEG